LLLTQTADAVPELTDLLADLGHETEWVGSAAEAEARLLEHAGELLLIDLTALSGREVFDLCHRLKRDPTSFFLPVVALAPANAIDLRLRAIKAGIEVVLDPLVQPAELKAQIQARLVGSRQGQRGMENLRQVTASAETHVQMTAFLVHDLKTPLTSILTNLQLLEARLTDEHSQRFINDGKLAARRLERMLLDMLDVRRMRDGLIKLRRVEIPLDDLVEEAFVTVRPMALAKGIDLHVVLGEAADRIVLVDFDLMTRLLTNLLENAVRHSPEGSAVHIRALLDDDEVDGGFMLCIDDCGDGVPPEDRERIFGQFVQLDGQRLSREGRGLGLAFCRGVAEAHGLDIGVTDNESGGSRFYLRFHY